MSLDPPAYSPCDDKEHRALPDTEEPDSESPESPQRLKMFNYLIGFTRFMGALLVILVVAWIGQYRGGFGWATNSMQKFNWHPMLMTLGLVLLYSNALLIYRTQRSVGMQRLKMVRAGIMIFCVILTMIGLVVGFQNHDEARPGFFPNMYSVHSWVGLTTAILFFFQCTAGFLSFLYPEARPDLQTVYKQWHNKLGIAGFVGAVISCFLGFNEMAIFAVRNFRDYNAENTIIWFIYLTLITFGGLSVYLISENRFKRVPINGDDEPLTKEIVFGNLCPKDKPICCLPWTPNDCARSVHIIFSPPQSNALPTAEAHWPPAPSPPAPPAYSNK